MADEMKFNHEADNVGDAIPGVEFDKIQDIGHEMTTACRRFSEYAEFIHKNIDNPTALYLFTRLTIDGLEAMGRIEREEK